MSLPPQARYRDTDILFSDPAEIGTRFVPSSELKRDLDFFFGQRPEIDLAGITVADVLSQPEPEYFKD